MTGAKLLVSRSTGVIYQGKDLSADQRTALERLLGRPVQDEETISVRSISAASAPEWLQESWDSAEQFGLDRLSMEQIDVEIEAARSSRRDRRPQ